MSVFTVFSFVFLAFFSPISLASALPDALPCPDCVDEPPIPVQVEPCHECEYNHPKPPPAVIVTKTECEHDDCDHHTKTKPFVFTSTISTCRRQTTSHYTPYTSGSATYFISSCKPTTLTKTQHGQCEESPASTITVPGSVSVSTTTFFGNGSAITICGTSVVTSYRNNSRPGVAVTSYAAGPAPNTVTVVTTKRQPGETTTVAGSPTDYITVTKGRRTLTSTTTSYVTVAGGNATCNAFTQTLTLTTKKTKTRSQPANTNTVGGVSSVTITTQYPSCDHITRTVQNTVTEYGATAPSQVTITATRRIRAVTITMTAAAQTITATTTATTEAVGPVQYSTVPTTEYATLTSYASGSPPATIYLTRTRTTTVTASTSNAPPSTVVSVRRVVRTNTQTVMETTTSVTTVVQTTRLPAQTSFATVTQGTQTVVTTLSVATTTFTTQPPPVTETTFGPASTRTTTIRPAARTITVTATSDQPTTVLVTTTLPGSTALRTRTRTITATLSAGTITTTITVTNTLAAATVTETTTKVNVRTRTQTTEVVSTATLTATATSISNVITTATATITRVQTRRITTTKEQPAGYCTPTTQTITNTATATSTQTITRTRTITETAVPPPDYCNSATVTTTQTRTVTTTTRAPCATAARPTVANCVAPTGQFRIIIQNFGSAYLTASSGGGKPVGDHQSLTLSSQVGQAVQFSAVSNGQTSFVTVGGKTLYSDQDAGNAGNSPIFFDSLDGAPGYDGGSQPVQFCLQPDNTFVVQNPADGATSVMMCAGVINLFTAANAATSGCTPVTLVKA